MNVALSKNSSQGAPGAASGLGSSGGEAPSLFSLLARRQMVGIFRLELRNHLLSKTALLLYFLAFAPVGILFLWALSPATEFMKDMAACSFLFATFYQLMLGSMFLANLIVFMSLFRREILERSLHYYFLTPVRREVLVLGKYLTALVAVSVVYVLAVSVAYLLAMSPFGMSELMAHMSSGPGLKNLLTYGLITVMACTGYGAIFMLAGLIFRNPIVPAAILFIWEGVGLFLPAWLKKLSVYFYLQSLFPVPVAQGGLFATLAEGTPAWISVPGFVIFAGLVLAVACWRARTMEVAYGGED